MGFSLVAAAVIGGGASVYSAGKGAKAANNLAQQQAQQNQDAINAANAQAEADRTAANQRAADILAQSRADSEAALTAATAASAAQLKAIQDQGAQAASWQSSMMQQQQQALQEAKDAALLAAKNTAQKARAPNYSRSMADNVASNRKGIASTMLTGPGGVDAGSLSLGRATLLGGAAA